MSAYIDCGVCRSRLICTGDEAATDARFTTWANAKGWVVGDSRCPVHAGDAGLAAVAAAVASRAACTSEHDSTPWTVYAGIASGGGGVYNGGGPTIGRATLAPREEFCGEKPHYWSGVAA